MPHDHLPLATVGGARSPWIAALLSTLVDVAPLGIMVVDNRSDDILFFNDRFCELWGIERLAPRIRSGELKNNDIIPDCVPVLADVEGFAASCAPLQDEDNRSVVEDFIPFVDGRTIKRFSAQLRAADDAYLGRFYIFEDVTALVRAEQQLRERLDDEYLARRFSKLVSDVSPRNFDERVEQGLHELCDGSSADFVRLLATDRLGRRPVCDWSWSREAGFSRRDYPCQGPQPLLVYRAGLRGETAIIDAAHPLSADADDERAFWAARDVQALVNVPLFAGGELSGFLVLESVARGHAWPERDVRRVTRATDAASRAVARRRNDESARLVAECLLGFGGDYVENPATVAATIGRLFDPACVLVGARVGDELVIEAGWNIPADLPRRDEAAGRVCTAVIERGEGDLLVVEDLQRTAFAETDPMVRRYGLRGDEITLGARIIAVADVVEAMASHRPYRPALGIDAALAEIERGSGVQFDAGVAAACVALFREAGFAFSA